MTEEKTSFASSVKSELLSKSPSKGKTGNAELYAMLVFAGVKGKRKGDGEYIKISSDNPEISRKCFTLLKKGTNIEISARIRTYIRSGKNDRITILIKDPFLDRDKGLLKDKEAKRLFLRGAFESIGHMSNPESGYHLEFVCDSREKRDMLLGVCDTFSLKGRTVVRKRNHIVYFKEGETIADLLNIMGAHRSLMEFENLRILKEMRGNVNRRGNCETANIAKTVNAASRQLNDIAFLKEKGILWTLPETLQEIAILRADHPDATLSELSDMCKKPIGRSGINHRLRKLSEEADRYR